MPLTNRMPWGNVLSMYWCWFGLCVGIGTGGIGIIGVGIVVGIGMCIGICVGVGIGIGAGIGSVSQHLPVFGIIWWHPGAAGRIWQHLGASGLATSSSIWDHLWHLG